MAYGMPCEALRFAGRNGGFVRPFFSLARRAKRNRPAASATPPPQIASGLAATKLRKGAAKPMTSLARVILCAGLKSGEDCVGRSTKSRLANQAGDQGARDCVKTAPGPSFAPRINSPPLIAVLPGRCA